MKDEQKSAEKFFSAGLSKKLGRDIQVAIMWVDFDDIDVPNPPYHKTVSDAIVEEMYKNFNPVVAGFLVANVREDGKIALVDGRHRREMAIKSGEKGWEFIVTHGLKIDEEARLFRWFQKRKNMTQAENLKALILERDPAALALRSAVTSLGCCFPFDKDKERHPIRGVEALIWIFERGGAEGVKRVLRFALDAWLGVSVSLTSTMLKAMWIFTSNKEVREKLDHELLRTVLKSLSADALLQRGRMHATQERCGAAFGIASIIRLEYNKKTKGKRRVEHDFVHIGQYKVKARSRHALRHDLPEVPPDVLEEIRRRASATRLPVSARLFGLIKAAVKDNYSRDAVTAAYGISPSVFFRARREALGLEPKNGNG